MFNKNNNMLQFYNIKFKMVKKLKMLNFYLNNNV